MDIRILNGYPRKYKLMILTIKVLCQAIHPGDWFTSIDLQETYQGTADEYMKLPFRRSVVFTKRVEAALNLLGDSGLSIHSYIDDYLLCLHTEALSARDTSTPLTHLTNLVSELTLKRVA